MVTTSHVALPAGATIGAYRVDGVLGAGAWTITYQATEQTTREQVALREFFPELLCKRAENGPAVVPVSSVDQPELASGITRFMRWARTVATVRHENVATVRRVMETNGTAYLATRLVDGAPLDALLRPGEQLDPQELEEILPGLLSGLDAIHRAGLYHRSIHPGALFVSRNAEPVLDLPAADWQVEDPDVEIATHVRAYASPELLVREDFGTWSDIYSLCATLFRMVTGQPPPAADARAFPNQNRPDTIANMLADAGNAWRTPLLETIARGMALSPRSRPPSVTNMRARLEERYIEEPDTVPMRPHRRSGGARTQRLEEPPSGATPDAPDAGGPDVDRPTSPRRRGSTELELDKPTRRADPDMNADGPPAADPPEAEPDQERQATNEDADQPDAPPSEPPKVPDDSRSIGGPSSIVYRRGRPEEVDPPSGDDNREPAGTPNIAPARFTLYHPEAVGPRTWGTLVIYLHESGIASIIARQETERREGPLTDRAQPRDDTNMLVRPGAEMLVVPTLRGGRVNAQWARIQWVENFQRLEFRIAAAPDANPDAGQSLEGTVAVYAGALLVGETPFTVQVAARPEEGEPVVAKSMSYSRVFPSFAGEDQDMVHRFVAAAESVNMPYLKQVLELRAQGKDRAVRRMIQRAERYQLCWSSAGSASPKLRREWEEAKGLKRDDFIRISSWDRPMPAPPAELADSPVQRLPLLDD